MNERSKTKKKNLGKVCQKPFGNDLQEFPELQIELEKVSGKLHPIDTRWWVNRVLIGYARDYMNLAQKMVVTQNCHHNLPKNDDVLKVAGEIAEKLYENASENGNSEESRLENFDNFSQLMGINEVAGYIKAQNLQRMTLNAFLSAYWIEITTILFTIILVGCLNFSSVYATKQGLDLISQQIRDHESITDKEIILFYFGVVWIFGVLSSIFMNWLYILMTRMSMRFFSGYTTLIFEKLLRVGITNPFEHGEGSIINYIQNDLMAFDNGIWYISQLFCSKVNMPLALTLG